MDLKDVKDGTNYKTVRDSRNLVIIMDKCCWESGRVKIADTNSGLWREGRVNGSILLDVGVVRKENGT